MEEGSIRQKKRDTLVSIFRYAVDAVKPDTVIPYNVVMNGNTLTAGGFEYDLDRFERIILAGAGKASALMARAMYDILGERINGGIINVKYGHSANVPHCVVNECGHPLPDEKGLEGTEKILELLDSADERTLVIFLASGGGSVLMTAPADEVTLEDLIEVNKLLLSSGAEIGEMNSIRKHLSRCHGGHIALIAYPATVLTLIISDVVGNRLDVIASGPAVPDTTTYSDALRVIRKYKLDDRIPARVLEHLRLGAGGEIEETPKPVDRCFERVKNIIIAHNSMALDAAKKMAGELGLRPMIIPVPIEGEARDAARFVVDYVRRYAMLSEYPGRPNCLIFGGETTVTIRGNGKGGRNTEFALAAAIEIDGTEQISLISCGTDGTDGPTGATGAFCDGATLRRGAEKGLRARQHLDANDSYTFFNATGDLIITGPTGTNVMDIQIALINS